MANALFEITDGKLELHPHLFQMRTLESEAQQTYVLKGWRGGYTSIAPWWMRKTMVACGPGNLAKHYLCITPTLRGARGGLLDTMRSLFEYTLDIGEFKSSPIPKIVINKKGEQMLWGHEQREPTEIHFVFAEDPNSFAHYTALAICADEVGQPKFKRESYNVAMARMETTKTELSVIDGRPKGRWLGGTTVYNLGWVEDHFNTYKAAVYRAWKELNEQLRQEPNPHKRAAMRAEFMLRHRRNAICKGLGFIRFDSTRNPAISKESFEEKRASLPDWFFRMRYCARFARPAGQIFEAWNPGKHVVEPFELPKKWPRTIAIDFGRRNFYATFWAHDEERDRHFLYDSYHDSNLSNQDRAGVLREKEPNIAKVIAGQISEDHERAELASGGLPSMAPAFKDLWTGINNVAAAIKLNKVFVFEGACDGVLDEFRNYSRPIDEDGNVDLNADPVDKDSFHWCFVAGTMIETDRGQVPVEKIWETDRVLTRDGFKPVIRTDFRVANNVRKVTFSDGRTLIGTGDHPVFIQGRGFVSIDSLRYYDIINVSPNWSNRPCLLRLLRAFIAARLSSSKERSTTAIQTLTKKVPVSISTAEKGGYIVSFGHTIMVRFLKEWRFTTKTVIPETILSRTSKWWKKACILLGTKLDFALRPCAITSTVFAPLPQSGIARQKERRGTANTLKTSLGAKHTKTIPVFSAAPTFRAESLQESGFAATTVKLHGAERTTGSLKIARTVAKSTWLRKTFQAFIARIVALVLRTNSADVYVVSVSDAPDATVYNLTVHGTPEYYANGVLVHNCDSVRYYGTYNFSGVFSQSQTVRAGGQKPEKSGNALPASSPARAPALLRAGGGKIGRARARKYGDAGFNSPYLDIDVR